MDEGAAMDTKFSGNQRICAAVAHDSKPGPVLAIWGPWAKTSIEAPLYTERDL
jgi:hypothetical protein